jgi:hypothetical protein
VSYLGKFSCFFLGGTCSHLLVWWFELHLVLLVMWINMENMWIATFLGGSKVHNLVHNLITLMSLILSVSMKCLYIAKDLFSKNWMIVGLPIYIVEPCPFEVMMWHSPCGFLHVEFHLNLLTSWRCEFFFFKKRM